MLYGTDSRLTGQRGQWGVSGTAIKGTIATVMDATAQNASRLAVQIIGVTASAKLDADLTITSAVESGVWQRIVRLSTYGVCIAVPQGRVTASITNRAADFAFRSTFGEGVVSREWQTQSSGVIAVAGKPRFTAPPYARRVRVVAVTGGPFEITADGFAPGPNPIVTVLPAPGGQTEYLSWAPQIIEVGNLGAGEGLASIEWEVLA